MDEDDRKLPAKTRAALPASVRRLVPFELRVGVRRLPHVARWMRRERLPLHARQGVEVASRSSPLRRPNTTYEEELQRAKEQNVERVARALNGARIEPGTTLSWHERVGPPLRVRGFASGPELHEDKLARGAGGGACQVANLVFWLGAMSGLDIIERHRHAQDLFADHRRTVPFGCGATVFYPHRDLKLKNPHAHWVQLDIEVRDGRVYGAMRAPQALEETHILEERDARFVRTRSGIWRSNRIVRVSEGPAGRYETHLVDNRAKVAYEVDEALLETS